MNLIVSRPAEDSPAEIRPGRIADLAVRGLLFDLGDVLYDATVWRRWLLQQISRLGLYTHYAAFYRVWDRDFLPAVHRRETTYTEALRKFLRAAGLSTGQIDELVVAARIRRRELEAGVRPLYGVPATLAALKARGFRMGVLANSSRDSATLQRRLVKMGIAAGFEQVISTRDSGHILPEREAYTAACQALGTPSAETAFVGHDSRELAGAREAGLKTIAFNFDRGAEADACLERFEELIGLPAPAAHSAAS